MTDFPVPGVTPANWGQQLIDATRERIYAGLPSYADERANPFDAMRNAYNWKATNTRNLRAALGKARAGSGLANILHLGDSLTQGKLATGSMNRAKSWPIAMRDALEGTGFTVAGDGLVMCGGSSNDSPYDPRITFSGTWAQTAGYAASTTNGGTLTYTTGKPCSSVDIWYSGNSGPFNVAVDGGASTLVTPPGTTTWLKHTWSGSLGAHTVVCTKTNTTATNIKAVNGYSASGIAVHNLGLSGWAARDWITFTSWFQWAGGAEIIAPKADMDAVVINLGINDLILLARTPAQAVADLATLVGRWTPGPDVVLILETHVQALPEPDWETFADLLYDLADSLDVPLIDQYQRFGTFTEANAIGLYGDASHLTTAGYADWGRNVAMCMVT